MMTNTTTAADRRSMVASSGAEGSDSFVFG